MGSFLRRVQQGLVIRRLEPLETPQKWTRRVFTFEISCTVRPGCRAEHPKLTRGQIIPLSLRASSGEPNGGIPHVERVSRFSHPA